MDPSQRDSGRRIDETTFPWSDPLAFVKSIVKLACSLELPAPTRGRTSDCAACSIQCGEATSAIPLRTSGSCTNSSRRSTAPPLAKIVGCHEAGGFRKAPLFRLSFAPTWQVRHERVDADPQQTLFPPVDAGCFRTVAI